MKVLAAIMMFVTMGVLAKAQTVTTPAAPEAKVIAEISSNKGVKNSPFSADAVSESVQIFADGNRIVRSSTSKMYRNSEGRFRQEITGGTGGMFGSFYSFGDGISVFNPMGGSFALDVGAKVARVFEGVAGQGISIAATAPVLAAKAVEATKLSPAVRAEIEALKGQGNIDTKSLSPASRAEIDKMKVEMDKVRASADEIKVAASHMATTISAGVATTIGSGMSMFAPSPKWETRTEELGEQNIEGVSARGTRTITTIPAGAIGNERAIETVYEKWYSPELQMVVLSRHTDPRFGEQTYRLTNINRSEPDSSLFQVPSGYKKVSGGQGGSYVYNTSKAQQVERAAATRSAQSGPMRTKPQQD